MAEVKMERSSLDADSLPNNSLVAKQKAKDPKKTPDVQKAIQPVAQGSVEKKSFGRRFIETLGLSDGRTVGDYLLWDVIVPAGKDLVNSIVTNGISVLLYGNAKPRNVERRGATSRVSYGRYYEEQRGGSRQQSSYSYNPRGAFDFAEVTYPTRAEGEKVLDEMVEIVDAYEFVKVSEFLQLSNVPESQIHFTDADMGWDRLGGVEVVPVQTRSGVRWGLTLPKPIRR